MNDLILQYFEFKHLPKDLQIVSQPFHKLAHDMAERLPSNPEREMFLRKLLEAKDCAVRSTIWKSQF